MNDIVTSILLMGAMSSSGDLPFWAVSNNFGLMPQGSGGLAIVQATGNFKNGFLSHAV